MTYQGLETVSPKMLKDRRAERAFKRELQQTKPSPLSRSKRKEIRAVYNDLQQMGYPFKLPTRFLYR